MNSFHSELARLGLVEAKESQPTQTKQRVRKPKWPTHGCKELGKVQEQEAGDWRFDGEAITAVILPCKAYDLPQLRVPYPNDHGWPGMESIFIPVSFCPFCGEKLVE